MGLSSQEMDRLVDQHFGFEAADDVEGVLGTLTGDVDHDVVGFPGSPLRGREAARAFYEVLFRDLKGEKAQTLHRYYGEDFMVDETLWTGRAVGRPFGLEGKNRSISFRLLHLFKFRGDKIERENVWVDLAAVMQQLSPSQD